MSTSCEPEAAVTSGILLVPNPCPGFLPFMPLPPIIKGYRLCSLLLIYVSTKVAHKNNICMSNPLDLISPEMLLHSRVKLHCPFESLTISRMPLKPWTGLGRAENFRKLFPKYSVDVNVRRADLLLSTWPKHIPRQKFFLQR